MSRMTAALRSCPKCNAAPNEPCRGRRGNRKAFHIERHDEPTRKSTRNLGVRATRCKTLGRIYFIRAEETKFIKIGWSKLSPSRRLKQLQTGCPHRLLLLADMPGDQGKEKSLHAAFKAMRVEGEWFRDEGSLSDLIDCLLLGGGQ